MTKSPIFCVSILFICITNILPFNTAALSPEEKEIQVLNLFFKANELVVSATHYPKPLSQVAENVSVVTAADIKAMNAHSVLEVLNRVPGLFIAGYDRNFGTVANLSIQGSDDYHVLVLLDGTEWNYYSGGNAVITDIPIGIVERIEVIKGPASAVWGSSLGGVVNIITKSFDTDTASLKEFYASYAERQTSDLRAQWSENIGNANLYLYAGRMDSDGLRAGRSYEKNSFFSKLQIPVGKKIKAGISAGYSNPEIFYGSLPLYDLYSSAQIETFFAKAYVDTSLTDNLRLNITSDFRQTKNNREDNVLNGDWWDLNQPGDILQAFETKDARWQTSGKLVWKKSLHTTMLGVDYEHGKVEDNAYFAPGYGYEDYRISPKPDEWAIYVNSTIVLNQWSITPGIRYDENDTSGGFVSPSLSATYQINDALLMRAVASRGFTSPPAAYTSGGGLFVVPNPDLEPETITSYQVGMEAGLLKRVWIKGTLFRHEVADVFFKEWDALGPYMDMWINAGSATRQGAEMEIKAQISSHISIYGGYAYVHHSPETVYSAANQTSGNLTLSYEKPDFINVRLMGHYLYWDEHPDFGGSYNDSIWDVNISKSIGILDLADTEIFLTGRNLFNGASYDDGFFKNPVRWFETGMRLIF